MDIMHVVGILISLISGAIGGNLSGAAMEDKGLGTIGNTITGILGGGAGNALLQYLGVLGTTAATTAAATGSHEFSLASLLANIAASGAGGAIIQFIVSMIMNAVKK